MRFTSITHCASGNFQCNFFGPTDRALDDFAGMCKRRGADWGHMFEEKRGTLVASYSDHEGLTLIEQQNSRPEQPDEDHATGDANPGRSLDAAEAETADLSTESVSTPSL